jgi:hypothetical protein
MNNYDVERRVFRDLPLDYDNLIADAAERINTEANYNLGSRSWDYIIDEVLLLAREVLDEE